MSRAARSRRWSCATSPAQAAGPSTGRAIFPVASLELTEADDRQVYVRYLTPDAVVGDGRPAFATVGTYPFDGAYAEVRKRAGAKGMDSRPAPGGGLATWSTERPTSIYTRVSRLGRTRRGLRSRRRARTPACAVRRGRPGPIVGAPRRPTPPVLRRLPNSLRIGAVLAVAVAAFLVVWLLLPGRDQPSREEGPRAATIEQLEKLAGRVDHSVYWAGPQRRHKYELTPRTNGWVYVRYLPEGVEVGDPRANFLTVATYPQPDGFGAVSASSKEGGMAKRKLPDGGLAVFNERRPTSVFFSYPGARYQVEVYHPTPGRALRLVVSEQVVPIR